EPHTMFPPREDFEVVLLRRRVVSPAQLTEVFEIQKATGVPLDDVLVKLGYASAEQLTRLRAEWLKVPLLDLPGMTIPQAVIGCVPESVAGENLVLPVSLEGRVLTVAMADPTDADVLQKLEFILNRHIRPALAPRQQIVDAINRYYGQSETESVDSMLC